VRLVLDTNIIVKAFRSPGGGAGELLRAVRRGDAALLVSPPLFFEYEQVVPRPEHLRAAGATPADAERFSTPWPAF
jgi:predicted nucleic acid-binding protein